MNTGFDFDAAIDRNAVPALKTHPAVLGDNSAGLFAAGVADMDFKVAPAILDAMRQRLEHGVFGYEAVPPGLLGAVTDWLNGRHDWTVDAGCILRAPNVLNSLAIAASLFAGEGDGIIVQPPVFFDFFDVVRENRRVLVENPLLLRDGRYEMNFDHLAELASRPANKMLFLCNPHNPVGRVWSKEELTQLGDICSRHGVLIVSDELHGDITFSPYRYTPFASLGPEYARNSITLLSPAKSFNIASVCCSFTVVPDEERRSAFKTENSRLTVNKNNAFSSVAMEAAYRNGGGWLDAAKLYLQGNLDLVRRKLHETSQVRLIEPEGTFLLWLDFGRLGLEPDQLTKFLRTEARWAVTRGIAFGEQGAGFARLNIATQRAKLSDALDQLLAAFGIPMQVLG